MNVVSRAASASTRRTEGVCGLSGRSTARATANGEPGPAPLGRKIGTSDVSGAATRRVGSDRVQGLTLDVTPAAAAVFGYGQDLTLDTASRDDDGRGMVTRRPAVA